MHLLELEHNGGAIARDGGADARQDGIGRDEFLAVVVERWVAVVQPDREALGVENRDLVIALFRGFDQAAC